MIVLNNIYLSTYNWYAHLTYKYTCKIEWWIIQNMHSCYFRSNKVSGLMLIEPSNQDFNTTKTKECFLEQVDFMLNFLFFLSIWR